MGSLRSIESFGEWMKRWRDCGESALTTDDEAQSLLDELDGVMSELILDMLEHRIDPSGLLGLRARFRGIERSRVQRRARIVEPLMEMVTIIVATLKAVNNNQVSPEALFDELKQSILLMLEHMPADDAPHAVVTNFYFGLFEKLDSLSLHTDRVRLFQDQTFEDGTQTLWFLNLLVGGGWKSYPIEESPNCKIQLRADLMTILDGIRKHRPRKTLKQMADDATQQDRTLAHARNSSSATYKSIDWSELDKVAKDQDERKMKEWEAFESAQHDSKLWSTFRDAFGAWSVNWVAMINERQAVEEGRKFCTTIADGRVFNAKDELSSSLTRMVAAIETLGLDENLRTSANNFDASVFQDSDDAISVKYMLKMLLAVLNGETASSIIEQLLSRNPLPRMYSGEFAQHVIAKADQLPLRCQSCGILLEPFRFSCSTCSKCELPVESREERYRKGIQSLQDVRLLLNAHYHRCDQSGISPVEDLYKAVEQKIEGLRVALVRIGLVKSGERIAVKNYDVPTPRNETDDLDRLIRRLIELEMIETEAEAWRLPIDLVLSALYGLTPYGSRVSNSETEEPLELLENNEDRTVGELARLLNFIEQERATVAKWRDRAGHSGFEPMQWKHEAELIPRELRKHTAMLEKLEGNLKFWPQVPRLKTLAEAEGEQLDSKWFQTWKAQRALASNCTGDEIGQRRLTVVLEGMLKALVTNEDSSTSGKATIKPTEAKSKLKDSEVDSKSLWRGALLKHHNYGGDLNLEPATPSGMVCPGLSKATASRHFKERWHGHVHYTRICGDPKRLEVELKLLAGDLPVKGIGQIVTSLRERSRSNVPEQVDE